MMRETNSRSLLPILVAALACGCGEGRDRDAGTDADAADGPDAVPDADPDVPGDTPVPDVVEDGPECVAHEDCEDLEPCTVDECLMGEGVCRHTPMLDGENCDDGTFCNGYETCVSGECTSSGDPCGGGSACVVGTCDEGADTCNPGPAPDGTSCDNGVWCDGSDECVSGACESGPGPCTGGDGVCSYATCDESSRSCGVGHVTDGTSCDDGDPCNGSDQCEAGTCVADPHRPCDDWNGCTTDACTPDGMGGFTCLYVDAAPGATCTDIDTCSGAAGRVCVAMGSGSPACAAGTDALCADGSLCTVTECRAGTCSVVTSPPAPPVIPCGGSLDGSTLFGASDVSSYGSCGSGLTGGESVFRVSLTGGTSITVSLTDVSSSGPLTVMVLSDRCSPSTCMGAADTGGTGSLSVTVSSGVTYYVVVDGASNARGTFTVSATCG